MKLFDEEKLRKEQQRNRRFKRAIVISIVVTVIIVVTLILVINYLVNNPNRTIIKLNGKENRDIESLIQIQTDPSGNVSLNAPIKEISSYFGYEPYNGEYASVSESSDSCYVQCDNEIAMFKNDSDIVYKLDITKENSDYEYCKLSKKVFEQNGKLYTNDEGLANGFNLRITYDSKKRVVNIYTLDALVSSANQKVLKLGYKELEKTFINHKALLENMMVVTNKSGQMGVVDFTTGATLLDAKYDQITLIPNKGAFIVTKDNKSGIIGKDGSTKIAPEYDSLTLIDPANDLYMAQKNGLYGVVNVSGKMIIYLEYNKIGVDITQFAQNDVKSGYVLLNKLIPVQQNEKWCFFDINGHQITDLKYESIGCITSTKNGVNYNLLVVPDCGAIVVKRDGKYTFVNSNGEELLSCVFKDMYIEMDSGKKEYFMVWQDNTGQDRRYYIREILLGRR